jgi:integrase/recombinase XerD
VGTAKPISDSHRRMLQDMTNRNFGDKTQHDYIRHIETFAKFLGRSPETALRRFQAQQVADGGVRRGLPGRRWWST